MPQEHAQLEFKPFRPADFLEYAAWFTDPALNRWLGPVDADWLTAVLSDGVSGGATWAILSDKTFVAVAQTALHPDDRLLAAITGLAVKPELRGKGLGGAVLKKVLAIGAREGRLEHLAYIHEDNIAAQKCFGHTGFVRVTLTPNGAGYLEFRHATRQAQGSARV